MDIAIHKAKKIGCGWVTARGTYTLRPTMSEYCRHARLEDYGVTSTLSGSNHYGIVAHYTLRAVEQGLIVSYLLHLCTFDLINSFPGVTTIHC